MKLDLGMHIVMQLVFFGKIGVTVVLLHTWPKLKRISHCSMVRLSTGEREREILWEELRKCGGEKMSKGRK
jgi:hypothetical protein